MRYFYYKDGTISPKDIRSNKYLDIEKRTLHNLKGPAIHDIHSDCGYYYINGEYLGYNLSNEVFDKHVSNYWKRIVFE